MTDRWWDGDEYGPVRPSGTGSVSLLSMDEDDVRAAQARRGPLGFAAAPPVSSWGEGDWTARDIRGPT